MTAEVVERVRRSSRYRDVDLELVERIAAEELLRARGADDAVKRVKRRLHQVVGAFRGDPHGSIPAGAWTGDLADAGLRAACVAAMRTHASTRERIAHLDAFYPPIWAVTGVPNRLVDLGCGLNPLALPWMGLERDAVYVAIDADERPLATVRDFLGLVEQPHEVRVADLVTSQAQGPADVALMLKLVTTLDRQDSDAAPRLLRGLDARHAVVSFTTLTLGGRRTGMERTYRERLARLVSEAGRVRLVAEASVANELVFVLSLDPVGG
jgi:16S rRNA (guanine(1405)-N(7))-methyltransferase